MKRLWIISLLMISPPVLAQDAEPVAVPQAEPALNAPAPPSSVLSEGNVATQETTAAPTPAPASGVFSMPNASHVTAPPAQPLQAQVAAYFPVLPPSRVCARPDADGFWKLKAVYENPRGATSADFAAMPHQYLLFSRDNTYRTYKATWADKTRAMVRNQMVNETPAKLQQFVVHDSGFLYFYLDGVAVDVQACFIVANQTGEFQIGEMLLMPPEGQSAARLLKVYESVGEMNNPAQAKKPPARPRARRPARPGQ